MIDFAEKQFINKADGNILKRLKVYRQFMDETHPDSLDIGESNYIGRALGIRDNTLECDFNIEIASPSKQYNMVTCFEVFEHVMNPLQFMVNIRDLMATGGVLYLSTPKQTWSTWYTWEHHFAEYKVPQLIACFEYAGFKVEKYRVFDPFPLWFHFTGFRPFARAFAQRCVVFKVKKTLLGGTS
ncbi:MAG: methyltransferase domain-containing protein [Bacteroidota bacterium]